jgi:hypothetical protein
MSDWLLTINVFAGLDGSFDSGGAFGSDLGIEIDFRVTIGQNAIKIGSPAGYFQLASEFLDSPFIASDKNWFRVEPSAVFEWEAAVFLQSENGADEMLVTAHAAGNAVHSDLYGSTGHGGASTELLEREE